MATRHSEAETRRAQDDIVQIVTVVEELLDKARKLAEEHGLPFEYKLDRGEADWNDSGCSWESSDC